MSNQQPPSSPSNPSNPTTTAPPETTTTTPSESQSQQPLQPQSDLYTLGFQTRTSVLGASHVNRTLASANAFTTPMQETITEWAWGTIWNRPGLDRKQRSLLNLGMLIALNRQHELGIHVRGAVRNGLSELEIREAVMHALVYVGAPAGMEAMRTVDGVLEEMERGGEIRREIK